ncbi:ribokinase [Bradyrhizobium liaoningense]|uniref:ribokinase n=1 Tax=Bradyrhizobium liaoningense TaxID=43992 RepID=UPI001BA4F997|nr:ribokinase [Bradyrhizobium liaoningense]MBR0735624.1 ribokinase [Bradyrhizobium liaoningense]
MIVVFGSLNIDLVAKVPVIPGPGRTVLAPSYQTHFGGKGANQAVAAARIAGPGKVQMAGRVGRDGFGGSAIENLRANGVDADLVARADEPTGCAFITVDQAGENAITVASGANMTASAGDLPVELFNPDTVLVLQMEVPFEQAFEAARRTTLAAGTVVWNLAPVPEKMTREMVTELLAVTDHLLVNEHEALDAAGAIGLAPSNYEAAAADLARTGDLTCTVTAGAQGALAVTAEGIRLRAPAPRITPVDTTGAGDTFVGAFAAMLSEGVSLQRALEVSCEAAALKCLTAGAQTGMPMRSAVGSLA